MKSITLLTDFGNRGPYVAAMKAVIIRISPDVRIIDLTHNIAPQNILEGAFYLGDLVPRFPDGTVHLAVVDPGVGTERKLIAVEIVPKNNTGNRSPQYVVCPDNGLLSLLLEKMAIIKAVFLENDKYWEPQISRTFHGRDILAPVAAHISKGTPIEELGSLVQSHVGETKTGIVDLELPKSRILPGQIDTTVLFMDSFGNLILNIAVNDIHNILQFRQKLTLLCDGKSQECHFVGTYGDAEPGSWVLLEGSSGQLEIAVVGGNAAETGNFQPNRLLSIML